MRVGVALAAVLPSRRAIVWAMSARRLKGISHPRR
jgi:hypothetical protein